MRLLESLAHLAPAEVGVDLGRGQVAVSQEFLHDPDARASVQEMSGETVAQGVGRYASQAREFPGMMSHALLDRASGDPPAGSALEHGAGGEFASEATVLHCAPVGGVESTFEIGAQSFVGTAAKR